MEEDMKRNVLFVSVHPDDETLGCGGTILKHYKCGDQIYWLNLTGPTPNHPYNFTQEMIDARNNLLKEINASYGFSSFFNLQFPTQMLDTIDHRILITEIFNVYKKIKPDILYIPNRSDIHSDHRIGFSALFAAAKSFRSDSIRRILMYETLSETEFAPALAENAFIPNVFVDISDYLEDKIKIMELYDTEVMPDPLPRSKYAIRALAAYRGSRIGVQYAEAFQSLLEIL
jgi:LmbE family N-acetylglucosaminyl deacetylase